MKYSSQDGLLFFFSIFICIINLFYYGIYLLIIHAVGLAALLNGLRPRPHRLAVVGISMLILWNFGLAMQYSTGLIPRDQPVEMSTIVRNQIFEVPPRLAGVAWRFVVDRSSFYQTQS